ncbi:MAG: DsrE/DsrF/DrsH-like family protein [Desulfurococcales archaeon]|jgi:peroxiredoxin family protein|nr:DsrE/DsrF/DrsH-like family protein [Desulfurococcales archaeon]
MSSTEKPADIAIIVRSDRPESVYPAFILATTASTMGMKVEMFFTFWGLKAIVKGGAEEIEKSFYEELRARGMEPKGLPRLQDLISIARSSGNVRIYACSTTIEAMGISRDSILEGCPIVGAASFLARHGGGGSKILVF